MAKIAASSKAEAALSLGDNFYRFGVKSSHSSRFSSTFEHVYEQRELQHLPFWVIAGNHDHRASVDAQIKYSKRSHRWHFPSLYYNLSYAWRASSGEPRSAELIMIDTVLLLGEDDEACEFCPLKGPRDVALAEAEWSWIEARLRSSAADHLWVVGHHPIYSVGQDGGQPALLQRLLPLLKQYGAHYLDGHDHMAEHVVADGVQMFVMGMGMECCYKAVKTDTVPKDFLQFMVSGPSATGPQVGPKVGRNLTGGFASLAFEDEGTQVTYFDQDGSPFYVPPQVPRRRPAELVV